MITARLLNQDSRLNDYKIIGGIPYVNGDMIRVVIQLYNQELGVRHIPSVSATGAITLGVNFSDGTTNNLNMGVLDTADRSIWFVDILTSNVNSSGKVLVGGNLTFRMAGDLNRPGMSASNITEGIIFNALQRVIVT